MAPLPPSNNEAALAILNLKPLRDLARNFDLDIATCLQEYLDELQHYQNQSQSQNYSQVQTQDESSVNSNSNTSHDHDGSNNSVNLSQLSQSSSSSMTTMGLTGTNFTQGALLLQNSSCVYSRKVDYFYTLVYDALDSLKKSSGDGQKERQQQRSRRSSVGGKVDQDVEDFFAFDSELNFLCFGDDDLPLDKDGTLINLEERDDDDDDDDADHEKNQERGMDMDTTPNATITNTHSPRHSMVSGAALSITQLDKTMWRSMTHNPQAIKSHAAQALLRNLLDNGGDHNGGRNSTEGTLRLMSGVCDIEASTGGLLMPGTGSGFAIHVNNEVQPIISSSQRLDLSGEGGGEFGPTFDNDGMDDHYDNDDNDNDGDGFVLNSPQTNEQNREQDGAGEVVTTTTTTTTLAQSQQNSIKAVAVVVEEEKEKDPWLMLDPHNDENAKSRPLRVGITYRLPYDIDLPPSELVTGGSSNGRGRGDDDDDEEDENYGSQRNKQKKYPKAKPLKDNVIDYTLHQDCFSVQQYRNTLALATETREKRLSLKRDDVDKNSTCSDSESDKCGDHDSDGDVEMSSAGEEAIKRMEPLPMDKLTFEDEFLYVVKIQAKRRATERRRLQRLQMDKAAESKNAVEVNERFRDMYHDEDDYDDNPNDGPAFDFAGGEDDYGGGDDDGNDHVNISDRGDDSSKPDDFHGIFGNGNAEGGEEGNQNTFEELCRAHLKEFAKGAEKFAYETQLSRRVAKWQSKIAVVLEEEDERNDFDIQTYGKRILNDVGKNLKRKSLEGGDPLDDSIKFVSITCHQEPYEVCRTFLASLMLCNDENITFCGEGKHEISNSDELCVKILNSELGSPMENYLAPSAAEKMIIKT